MQKESNPNFFTFDIINIILTVIPFIAIFSFWNKLDDLEKILYIVIPFIVIILIVNSVNVNMKCHKNVIIKMSQFLIDYNYIY